MYFLYILRCAGGSLYTGITTDVQRRFMEHRAGKGGKYTRSHKPLEITYTEKCGTRSRALRREAEIKGWSHRKKMKLPR